MSNRNAGFTLVKLLVFIAIIAIIGIIGILVGLLLHAVQSAREVGGPGS